MGKPTQTARRKRRAEDSVTMQLTTTRIVVRALDAIKGSGLYGNSRAAAAERILAKGIEQLLREGTLIRLAKFFDKSKK